MRWPYEKIGVTTTRAFRNLLNKIIGDIGADMQEHKNRADNIQAQVDNLVADGDSSPEAAQARVGTDGTNYTTLKARLDGENQNVMSQLASKAEQVDLETQKSRIDNIVANTDNTEGNAELLDIRTDRFGKVFATAGDAVRAAVGTSLKKIGSYPGVIQDNQNTGTGGYSSWKINADGYFKSYFDRALIVDPGSCNTSINLSSISGLGFTPSTVGDFAVYVRITTNRASMRIGHLLNNVGGWGNLQTGQKKDYVDHPTNRWVKVPILQTQIDTLRARTDYNGTVILVFDLSNLQGSGYFEFMVLDTRTEVRKNKNYEGIAFKAEIAQVAETATIAENVRSLENMPLKEVLTENDVAKDPSTTGNTNSFATYTSGTDVIGVKSSFNFVDQKYAYSFHRMGTKLWRDFKGKKYRVYLQSDLKKDVTLQLEVANAGAWGSDDGKTGAIKKFTITLNAANNWQTFCDIDFSDPTYDAWYNDPLRAGDLYQRVFYLVVINDAIKQPLGTYEISHFAYEVTNSIDASLSSKTVLGFAKELDLMNAKVAINSLDNRVDVIESTLQKIPQKQALSSVWATKLSASTNTIDATPYVAGRNQIGFKMVAHLQQGDGGYVYTSARIGSDTTNFADLKTKKFRFVIQTEGKDTNCLFRLTNYSAWGSVDGSIATSFSKNLTLNAANDHVVSIDIDLSEQVFADFYAVENRASKQGVWFIISFENTGQVGDYPVYAYVYDLGQVVKPNIETEMQKKNIGEFVTTDELATEVDELRQEIVDNTNKVDKIVCWGDSLTAGGGWTTTLSNLCGLPVYNGGTGGEGVKEIMARQGADVMIVNNITIPADTSEILIASRATDGGIKTQLGKTVLPLLQGGGAHVNPSYIDGIAGTLRWTGTSYDDINGTWVWRRNEAGEARTINRPTPLITNFDKNYNDGIMIIYMGQNGGFASDAEAVRLHKLMIQHSNAKHTVILGYSSGTAAERESYEAAMTNEFGRYFISLREYLSQYGLDDAGITPTQADMDAMAMGKTPPSLLVDSVHYNAECKTVIGHMLYKKMRDLNLFD
ncbi:hypothetical protein ABR335_09155 [Heyndrickxia faecalis]|uniref:Uncharacterized protein n=1 Tax=Heyndrickxia faecalis TaxID=2824910 RepID=A0AAU7WBG8_9BACI